MKPKANSWGEPDNPFPHRQTTVYDKEREPKKPILYDHRGQPLVYKEEKRLGFQPERAT